ncbi:Chemotaxis protein CheA [Shimia sp. SK013]|uniref:chemotaxis protein CheA n=1 Tax=Shimia sp. SK013 TaxID=1389006 RepID=UPI0006B573D2|nr:chemotaxis protein CheA [Shimia sp. SK013]KPA20851.1 Chemotaxis protein CheA [Shimia sp. SK013]
MSDLRDMFFEECDDLMEVLSTGLDDLQNGNGDAETINAMFRSVHSIKGGGGAFGLDRLINFAHAFENVLEDLRSEKIEADPALIALMFSSFDHLNDLVDAARDDNDIAEDAGASILADLKQVSPPENGGADEVEVDSADFMPLTLDIGGDNDFGPLPDFDLPPSLDLEADPAPPMADPLPTGDGINAFSIEFSADPGLYSRGHDPALLFRALADLGDVTVSADTGNVLALAEAGDALSALSWTLQLIPNDGVEEDDIREVFEFVESQCVLEISTTVVEKAADTDLPELALPTLADEAPAPDEADTAVDATAQTAPQPAAKPAIKVVEAKPATGKKSEPRNSTIRVDLDRVDRLINLVGELVISEAMLRQSMNELPVSANSSVSEAIGQLKTLSGVLQESVMAIRAQPVRGLFQRMSRIVRESSRTAGKDARMLMIGDSTEVDKTVTERLVEPLTHMIRNSVDHGLETAEDRIKAGKPAQGTIKLEAAHRSGRVVISLSDDGAGINRVKVRKIAESKGLVRPEDDLTDSDIDNLLFRPGFSTADSISELSGRGVGLDVVRSEIQALGGRINLQSEPGKGTSMTISLPLTLAVMEGMLVTIEGESLVVPTVALRETLQPGQANVHEFCEGDRGLSMGGEILPIVDLGEALGFRRQLSNLDNQALLLIEGESGRRSALAVDNIIEQREVVIKGLEQNYQSIPGIAAATILGNGKIALIVDTDQMIPAAGKSQLSLLKGQEHAEVA